MPDLSTPQEGHAQDPARMPNWKEDKRYRTGEWTRTEFATMASELLDRLHIETDNAGSEPFKMRDRLIRYYTSEGALDRPGRGGDQFRFALYGYKHLVQLLVTRQLVNDGWPLAKAADFIKSHDLPQLEAMLPDDNGAAPARQRSGPARTHAENVIMGIRERILDPQTRNADTSTPDSMMALSLSAPPPAEPNVAASRSLQSFEETALRNRVQLEKLWRNLGHASAGPEWKDTSAIELAPGCTVIVDLAELKKMQPAAIDLVGEALTHALNRLRTSRRERK